MTERDTVTAEPEQAAAGAVREGGAHRGSHHYLRLSIRIIVLAVLVYALATRFAWREIGDALARMRPLYLLPVVFVFVPLEVLLRSWRWKGLLPGAERVAMRDFVRAYLLGFLANAILPGRLGDLVKARIICRPGIKYARSLASAIADRAVEAAALILVLVAVVLISGESLPAWAQRIIVLTGVATVVGLGGAIVVVKLRTHVSSVLDRLFRFLPTTARHRAMSVAGELIAGLELLADSWRLTKAALISIAVWGLEMASVVAFLAAFTIKAPMAIASVFLVVAITFGMLLPISPGSVGVYQLICVFALSAWAVPRAVSFSMGLAMQAALFLPVYLAGFFCFTSAERKGEKVFAPPSLLAANLKR